MRRRCGCNTERLVWLLCNNSLVHLAIDVQEVFKSDKADEVRKFSDRITIPTVWVACGHGVRLVNEAWVNGDQKRVFYNFSKCGDLLVDIKQDELVFFKDRNSAFSRTNGTTRLLADFLKGSGKNGLVVSGGNTTHCVTETVRDGLSAGFEVVVITDLLSDQDLSEKDATFKGLPQDHESALRKRMKDDSKVIFTTANEFVAVCKEVAAPAVGDKAGFVSKMLEVAEPRSAKGLNMIYKDMGGQSLLFT